MSGRFPSFAAVLVLVSSTAMAQFAGPAFFSTLPTSQVGSVTNNLVITNTANGFTVTGDATIQAPVAPPQAAGILVEWVIDRPLAASFTFSNWTTTTNVIGFSAPPPGSAGSTSGVVQTEFTEPGMQSGSLSQIPISVVNGFATWNLTNTSSTFSGGTPASPTYYLRQHFWLDGIYDSGPGGPWVVDVPVDSYITEVPEPATLALVPALIALSRRRR